MKILDVVVLVVENVVVAVVVVATSWCPWACHNYPSNGVAYASPAVVVVVVGLVVPDNYNKNPTFAVVVAAAVVVVDIAFACTCLKNRLYIGIISDGFRF